MSPAPEVRRPVRTAVDVCPVEVAVAVLGGTWKPWGATYARSLSE